MAIPHAASSETSSNVWNLSVISEDMSSAYVVLTPPRTDSTAERNSAKLAWYLP